MMNVKKLAPIFLAGEARDFVMNDKNINDDP